MSNWIAIYDPPADNEPPFECLVAGDVVENCIWVSGGADNYFQLCFSTALPLSHFPTHWRPAQSADHSELAIEKVAPDCRACANRGRINGLSQESYCDSCIYQGRDWRKNHFVDASKTADAVKRRCDACAVLPCSCE